MTTYYPTYETSRIADDSRSWQAAQGVDVTMAKGKFILAICMSTTKGPLAYAYKLQWRDVTDSGTFADVAASGEIKYAATSATLTDNSSLATGNFGCTGTGTAQAGRQSVNDNIEPDSGTFSLSDDYYTEFQWALDGTDAQDAHEYEFRLLTTGDNVIGTTVSITFPTHQTKTVTAKGYMAAADITVDDSVTSTVDALASRGGPFWVSPLIGYIISYDSTAYLKYWKTTDGGETWGSAQTISSTTARGFDCWADWQTPGDNGTKIHIAFMEATGNTVKYVYLDTNGDSVGGTDTIESCQGSGTFNGAMTRYNFLISICKSRGGNLCVAFRYYDDVPTLYDGFYTSPDGDTWTSRTDPWEGADDHLILVCGRETDADDIYAIFADLSAYQLTVKTFDDSGNSWSESSGLSHTANGGYLNFDAQVRLSDGWVVIAEWQAYDVGSADLRCYLWDGSTLYLKTDIITDESESVLASVFLDQTTDDIYVAYVSGSVWEDTVKVFYQKSSNGGTSWSGETAYMVGAEDDIRYISAGCMKPCKGGRFEPVFYNKDLFDIYVNFTNSVEIDPIDVTIDTGANTVMDAFIQNAGPFWTSPTIGYAIVLDSVRFMQWSKTTDGGRTWTAPSNIVSSQVNGFACWADWDTPGLSGTKIHLAYLDHSNSELRYCYFDTDTDTAGGVDTLETCQGTHTFDSTWIGWDYQGVSICRSVGGQYYVAAKYRDNSPTLFEVFYTSPDADTWTSESNTPWEGDRQDSLILVPGNETDTNDIYAIYIDDSTDDLSVKLWDDSGSDWTNEYIIGYLDGGNPAYLNFDAKVRHSDGHVIIVFWSDFDVSTADLRVFDLTDYDSGTSLTTVITDEAESALARVFIDQSNDYLYVAYVSGSAWSSAVQVFYQYSDDDGSSWEGETAYMSAPEADIRGIWAGSMKSAWGGRFQPTFFNTTLDDLFTSWCNSIEIEAGAAHTTKTGTAKARIEQSYTKTGTAKARIEQSYTKTGTAKGMVCLTQTKTGTAKARIQRAYTKTAGSVIARIEKSFTKTAGSVVARIEKSYTKTAGSVIARIEKAYTKTAGSVVARIQKAYTKTGTAKAAIWSQSPTKTGTALARMLRNYTKTSTVKARIEQSYIKTGTAKAAIVNSYTKTAGSVVARILKSFSKTGTAKAAIWYQSPTKTSTAKARMSQNYTKTGTSLARILKPQTKTGTAKAAIEGGALKTGTALARILRNFTKTGTSVARILKSYTKTGTAKAKISIYAVKTGTAKAAIWTAHQTKTGTALARVLKSFTKTSTSLARVLKSVTKTGTALAAIWSASQTKTSTALARIKAPFTKTGTAKAYMEVSGHKTKTGTTKAAIWGQSVTKTGKVYTRITKPQTRTSTAKGYIASAGHSVKSGTAKAFILNDMNFGDSFGLADTPAITVYIDVSESLAIADSPGLATAFAFTEQLGITESPDQTRTSVLSDSGTGVDWIYPHGIAYQIQIYMKSDYNIDIYFSMYDVDIYTSMYNVEISIGDYP